MMAAAGRSGRPSGTNIPRSSRDPVSCASGAGRYRDERIRPKNCSVNAFRTTVENGRQALDSFLLRLIISFIIGGTWVTIITEATLKYGPRAGGLLAGFPSTVPFSLLFIGLTQSADAAVKATTALPLALAFTSSFPLVYALAVRKWRFRSALLASLAFWATSSSVLSILAATIGIEFVVSLAGFYATMALAYYFLARRVKATTSSRGIKLSGLQWVWRFVLAGGIVVGAVLFSLTLGPIVGGVFASFPAIITSTVYIVSHVEGIEASRGIAVPVMVSTVFTIVPYTIVVRYAFPALGVVLGTLAGYAAAIPLSAVAYVIVRRMGRGNPGMTSPAALEPGASQSPRSSARDP